MWTPGDSHSPELGFGGLFSVRNRGLETSELERMVDEFLDAGLSCFDCAFAYAGEEELLARTLTRRRPRDSYLIAEKITAWKLEDENDASRHFETSLSTLGIDYVDFLMLHNVSTLGSRIETYERLRAWEAMERERQAGRARYTGISFHDTSTVLESVLSSHPEIDFVMLPINYLDWEDGVIQSRKNYEVARAHGKFVMGMKPLNGGLLASLPPKARQLIATAGIDPVELAFKFCASLAGMTFFFSTMTNYEEARRNIGTFANMGTLTAQDRRLIEQLTATVRGAGLIDCGGCGYCTATCPKDVKIPWIFSVMNMWRIYEDFDAASHYYKLHTKDGGKASECIRCGECDSQCPQKLDVMGLLESARKLFE